MQKLIDKLKEIFALVRKALVGSTDWEPTIVKELEPTPKKKGRGRPKGTKNKKSEK